MPVPFQLEVEPQRLIRGDLFHAQTESRGTLIICHGFKGFKDWGMFPYVAEQLSPALDVITFNFSHNGVGESLTEFTELDKFAKNTFSRELEDLEFLLRTIRAGEWLPGHTVAEKPLFLLGHSRGGGISLIYALDHPEHVTGVISWNGSVHLAGMFGEETLKEMRSKGRAFIRNARTNQDMPLDVEILDDLERHKERFNIVARIKDAQVPITLIQGTEDLPALRDGSAELVKENPAIRWVNIEGGNHTFNTVHPFQGETKPLRAAIQETMRFIKDVLS